MSPTESEIAVIGRRLREVLGLEPGQDLIAGARKVREERDALLSILVRTAPLTFRDVLGGIGRAAIDYPNLVRHAYVMETTNKAIRESVEAFAGQLQAWGFNHAASEIINEILGGNVMAPDYYALRARGAKLERELATVREELDAAREILSLALHADMMNSYEAQKRFGSMLEIFNERFPLPQPGTEPWSE